jgi:hypothetical protein
MTRQEVEEYLTCKCGGQFDYDGYETIEIEDGFIVIKGDCYCNECGKHMKYEDLHKVNFNEPYDVILEEV